MKNTFLFLFCTILRMSAISQEVFISNDTFSDKMVVLILYNDFEYYVSYHEQYKVATNGTYFISSDTILFNPSLFTGQTSKIVVTDTSGNKRLIPIQPYQFPLGQTIHDTFDFQKKIIGIKRSFDIINLQIGDKEYELTKIKLASEFLFAQKLAFIQIDMSVFDLCYEKRRGFYFCDKPKKLSFEELYQIYLFLQAPK